MSTTGPASPVESSSASPLRVALVCPYSLSRPGGVQGQVLGLARSLNGRGHQATVFAPLDGEVGRPTGIDLVVTGHSVSLPANGSIAPVTVSVPAIVKARRGIRATGYDVVHIHEPFTPGLPYGLLFGSDVPPLVATFHRSGVSPLYTLLRPVTRRLARRFAARYVVSDAARSTAFDALGGSYEMAFNGVEVDEFEGVDPWPSSRPVILFLGRHEERKGLQVLLEAFGSLAGSSEVRPVLWIAGDGPHTDDLRRQHPPSPEVIWLGMLSEEEKVRRLMAADVLCAPSLGGESFGMVLLEAMAARTVVVASDIVGYRDAANGHAVLVPPGDSAALAGALCSVLAGEALSGGVLAEGVTAPRRAGGPPGDGRPLGELRHQWLDAGSEWASHWSMTRLAEWYEARYRSVVVGSSR